MRYLFPVILVVAILGGCSVRDDIDRLGYQESGIFVIGEFTVGEDCFPGELTLAPPEYDSSGRMLVREGRFVFGEGSVIEGVGFEFLDGEMYIFSGGLKIPIEEESVIGGISSVVSLFCISEESYHFSQNETVDGLKCERTVYTDGENRVEVLLDLSTLMPISISADVNGFDISVRISEIRRE